MHHLLQFRLGDKPPSDHTDAQYRSAPTKDQILVPETLLKKRKAQEKAREQRNATIEKRKAVRSENFFHSCTR